MFKCKFILFAFSLLTIGCSKQREIAYFDSADPSFLTLCTSYGLNHDESMKEYFSSKGLPVSINYKEGAKEEEKQYNIWTFRGEEKEVFVQGILSCGADDGFFIMVDAKSSKDGNSISLGRGRKYAKINWPNEYLEKLDIDDFGPYQIKNIESKWIGLTKGTMVSDINNSSQTVELKEEALNLLYEIEISNTSSKQGNITNTFFLIDQNDQIITSLNLHPETPHSEFRFKENSSKTFKFISLIEKSVWQEVEGQTIYIANIMTGWKWKKEIPFMKDLF